MMTQLDTGLVLLATFVTSAISGVFGMAGGVILKGVLVSVTGVAVAMVLHGAIQLVANGSRALLQARQINWRVVLRYAVGGVPGGVLVALVNWRPDTSLVYLLLGLVSFCVFLPDRLFGLSVERSGQAEACGLAVQLVNLTAGVAGPILDLFFARTEMTRHAVVATKAATQVLSHAIKIVVWGSPLVALPQAPGSAGFPAMVLAGAIPLSIAGTWVGGQLLSRLTDVDFRRYTKWLLGLSGVVFLVLWSGTMGGVL